MKIILYVLLIQIDLLIFLSNTYIDSISKKNHKSIVEFSLKDRGSKNQKNSDLLLGCPDLITNKFPSKWLTVLDGESSRHRSINEIKFDKVINCFVGINRKKKLLNTPAIKNLKYVSFGETVFPCPDSLLKNGKYIYDLGNLGPYTAYYYYGNFYSGKRQTSKNTSDQCMEFGNIVLYDSLTFKGSVINLYYLFNNNMTYTKYRLFSIYKTGQIVIYESTQSEGFCTLSMAYNISISQAGKITIKGRHNEIIKL